MVPGRKGRGVRKKVLEEGKRETTSGATLSFNDEGKRNPRVKDPLSRQRAGGKKTPEARTTAMDGGWRK